MHRLSPFTWKCPIQIIFYLHRVQEWSIEIRIIIDNGPFLKFYLNLNRWKSINPVFSGVLMLLIYLLSVCILSFICYMHTCTCMMGFVKSLHSSFLSWIMDILFHFQNAGKNPELSTILKAMGKGMGLGFWRKKIFFTHSLKEKIVSII